MTPVREDVLDVWIRTWTPRLLAVARAFAADDDEAEDILQEVWIRAAAHGGALPEAGVGGWLYMTTLNVGRSLYRRRERRRRLRALWQPPGPQAADAAPVIGAELERRALWRAIAELPELQRRVLLLRTVDELSTRQAADALGRAQGTVKASLHRALATLRDRLRRESIEQEETGHG